MPNVAAFRQSKHEAGFSLIEVLIAVVVLSVGLLALAALQASLIRASAEAKAQSVGINLAEQQLEQLRSFSVRDCAPADCSAPAGSYQGMADEGATTLNLGGVTFTRTTTVTRFVRGANGLFAASTGDRGAPSGEPEFKQVQVNVAWTDATNQPRAVTLTDNVSVVSPADSANIYRNPNGNRRGPQVRIFAPTEEGIIPIAIGTTPDGTGIAAASSNPRPETFGDTGRTTTRFNVQTYSNDDVREPLLTRRVEYTLTSCSCTASGAVSTTNAPAFEPSFWDGEKYSTPKKAVGKRVGAPNPAADQDDALCTVCCRDHRDATASEQKFDPYRPSSDYANGDHNHYQNVLAGNTAPVTAGTYDEVCRFVRVGGANVVANDARLENLTQLRTQPSTNGPVLPAAVKTAYANFAKAYVESAVNDWKTLTGYPANPIPDQLVGNGNQPSSLATSHEALLDVANPKDVLSMVVGETRSLNSRGIYIDYLNDEVKKAINCIGQTTTPSCSRFANKQLLEVVPFLAVNLTFLSDWPQPERNNVSVTNAAIPLDQQYDYFGTGYSYDRGTVRALTVNSPSPPVDVVTRSYRGNSGSTDSRNVPATDPDDAGLLLSDSDEVEVTGTGGSGNVLAVAVQVTDASSNANNFDEGNVAVRVVSPQNLDTADACATLSTVNATTKRYSGCNIPAIPNDATATSITLIFTNYIRSPSCPSTGGWGLEGGGAGAARCPINVNPPNTTGQTCVKRTGNGSINDTMLPTLRDYELIVGAVDASLTVSTVTEGNDVGFPGETSSVTFSGPASVLRSLLASGVPVSFREDTTKFCANANP